MFARSSLSEATQQSNRDKAINGLACLLGAISGGLGVTFGTNLTSPQLPIVLEWLSQQAWLVYLPAPLEMLLYAIKTQLKAPKASGPVCFPAIF